MNKPWTLYAIDEEHFYINHEAGPTIELKNKSRQLYERLVLLLNFGEGLTNEQLEKSTDPAKVIFEEAYTSLDAYLEEIEYNLNERALDADGMGAWQGDQERTITLMKKIEPLTPYNRFFKEKENADQS